MTISKSIVFMGMMGTGKSTLGRVLATSLSAPFYDSDRLIETKTGQSIADIFTSKGEAAFRAIEQDVILPLLEKPPSVIAVGGGSVTVPAIRHSILQHGIVICLTAPVDILLNRVGGGAGRPLLLSGENPRAVLEQKMIEREAVYAGAHITLDTSKKSVTELVTHLEHLLSIYKVKS
jgi:shikimate kinase